MTALEEGLIEGYPDGSFRPNRLITRAETCTIVNRTLGRKPEKDHLLPESDMINWPDNINRNIWYYAQMQEATNSHDYRWSLGLQRGLRAVDRQAGRARLGRAGAHLVPCQLRPRRRSHAVNDLSNHPGHLSGMVFCSKGQTTLPDQKPSPPGKVAAERSGADG